MIRKPTEEQQRILDSTARVRIVRAAPGSGKTWLVAEIIRRELEKWTSKTSGIAALSFTRVAGEEIRRALGHDLYHPHYVGTIDAFIFRYVIRPFLRLCYPNLGDPRLLPDDLYKWSKYGQSSKYKVEGINVFGCVFIDEENKIPVLAYRYREGQPLQRLDSVTTKKIKDIKLDIWKKLGILTHSDVAFLASRVLKHNTFGSLIRSEISRRFPFVIVDELQDTGFFLGQCISLLLNEPTVRGALVGDPDQAIYEFNGAQPDMFDRFESIKGAVVFPLSNSRRCPSEVTRVAVYLKDTGGYLSPATDKKGRAFLVRYNDMKHDVKQVIEATKMAASHKSIKVITRGSATIDKLTERNLKSVPSLYCPTLNHMQRAVSLFRRSHQVRALEAARSALNLAVFEHEDVPDEKLLKKKINPDDWKTLAIECLFDANNVSQNGTYYEWQTKVGQLLDDKIANIPFIKWTPGKKLKPQKREGWDNPCIDYFPQLSVQGQQSLEVLVQTVHSVKGETHDVTIFICPETKPKDCPSNIWWSNKDEDREEKRIAYVAMTRTQGDLIVCVSNSCYQRLVAKRPDFVSCFQTVTASEFVALQKVLRQSVSELEYQN